MIALGLFLLTIGAFTAASFYVPFRKVRNWAWESYWLVAGIFSWIIMPWGVALVTVPELLSAINQAQAGTIFWTYLFGVLWGIGGLTFGLSIRYLGMSLGCSIALGFCALFGTIIPPIYFGTFSGMIKDISGLTTLSGVIVCLVGVAVCGWAGMSKENELSEEKKKIAIKEFDFIKGLVVAIFAGVMSACMALGFEAGQPIAQLAVEHGAAALWQNSIVLVIVLLGGFTTNFVWCVFLNIKNRTARDYIDGHGARLVNNYVFSAMAGILWYLQFMFYGMGRTKMGKYDFASWSVLMALIIVFNNMWGLIFREWKGSSRYTYKIIFSAIFVLIISVFIIGLGTYLKTIGK